jgi:DNA-binding beta-propeller fold protein YncE
MPATMDTASEPIKVGVRPWGVTRGFGGKYFVTVMGKSADGDGAVKVLEGSEARDFATALDEPQGICFTGKLLLVTDVKRVWRLDDKGGRSLLVDEDDFPRPPIHLTGIALEPGGKAVYVTDLGDEALKGRVYRIGFNNKMSVVAEPPAVESPTGLVVPRPGHLLVAVKGIGAIVEVQGKKVKVIAEGVTDASAVEEDAAGNLFVSSIEEGKVWRVPRGKPLGATVIAERAAGQLYLDRQRKVLLAPDLGAGTVAMLPVGSV